MKQKNLFKIGDKIIFLSVDEYINKFKSIQGKKPTSVDINMQEKIQNEISIIKEIKELKLKYEPECFLYLMDHPFYKNDVFSYTRFKKYIKTIKIPNKLFEI